MHKKLEADLISLAHNILKMKNREDVFALKEKSKEVYEKLSLLAFVEEYINETPNLETTKEDLLDRVEQAIDAKENVVTATFNADKEIILEEKIVYNLVDELKETPEDKIEDEFIEIEVKEVDEEIIEPNNLIVQPIQTQKVEEIIEQPFDELEEILFPKDEVEEKPKEKEIEKAEDEIINDVIKVEERKTMSLEEELQDVISVDVMADLFENAQPISLNDKLAKNIQIGLNDRIAFVKNLFNNQQEDYNRVVSQLNTFRSESEAKNFINTMVKPDYNWNNQEELETRFMEIIERKFA
ncbi:hypothetical protein BW723_07590 [Polaribacter reichenbachii]|uniref:Uncharacterized protein n=2 Tax=Polaribacter reichenbachii TaxID=996801 RepID=A0A1B8U6C0_9FLAO|nr:hypothetical protein [Polaribacter reichenbachii]APZ46167.1 hypothetical protein BW723_07590 [Polaribacter reichenbachii]AUC20029.1 hypothetical protein BTO17_15610 [Polaribacter reichenbachii]OBY67424.1 hypothetical protein LPB301_01900 [Polaribacter reichenbachii]